MHFSSRLGAFASPPVVAIATFVASVIGAGTLGCNRKAPEAAAGPVDAGSSAPSKSEPGAIKDASPTAEAVPSASVQAVLNPEKLPAYEGPTGFVEGTVLVSGPEAPVLPNQNFMTCPAALDTYGKLFRSGPPRADGLRPLADAVVVITGYHGFYVPEKAETARVVINPNCGYPTRTIAITFGQRLEIANDSRVGFAPVLSGIYQPAIMIAPPGQAGEPVKLNPPRPGHYVLGDEMQIYVHESVLVLPQPLHAVSDLRGHFRIEGVPVGRFKIGAQLDALGPAIPPIDVEVRPNVVENVELVIPYDVDDGGAGHRQKHIIP